MFREPKEIESLLLSSPDVKVHDEYAYVFHDGTYQVGVVLEHRKGPRIQLDLGDLEALVACLKESRERLMQMSKLLP